MTLPTLHTLADSPDAEGLVTMSDLRRLTDLLRCRYDVEARYDSHGTWVLTFTVADRRYVLGTVRGRTRRWRQLEPALAFMHAHCGDSRTVRLCTDSWTFSRISPSDN